MELVGVYKRATVCVCLSKASLKNLLTAFHLQQGFGQDAARHTDGLADVVPRILAVHICNGQLSA